jgi:hypothetical protein
MTIYAVLSKEQPPWIGYADSPEGACEQARIQGKNPPKPNNILVVIASDDNSVYTVYDMSELIKHTPNPAINLIQQCPLVGRYFVDYL